MNDKNSSGGLKFFVTKSGLGYEEGVYTQQEIKSLPAAARPHIISIGVAESLGYVVLDHKSGKTIDDLDAYAGFDPKSGKQFKLKNVKEGVFGNHKETKSIDTESKKIGNPLREKLQEIKLNSTEKSLKAQIEAKKKELQKK